MTPQPTAEKKLPDTLAAVGIVIALCAAIALAVFAGDGGDIEGLMAKAGIALILLIIASLVIRFLWWAGSVLMDVFSFR